MLLLSLRTSLNKIQHALSISFEPMKRIFNIKHFTAAPFGARTGVKTIYTHTQKKILYTETIILSKIKLKYIKLRVYLVK